MNISSLPFSHNISVTEHFHHFHIILVEPFDNANIGSVARAMMNLGFSKLHLVAPPAYKPHTAARTACWAKEILERATIHQSFEDSLESMQDVIGFSSSYGNNRRAFQALPHWVTQLNQAPIVKTALVFGPERTGLRNEHIPLCRLLVRIPSTVRNPSYNLAQAVLLVLYELSQKISPIAEPALDESDLPTGAEFQQLERIVQELGVDAGFFREDSPPAVAAIIRNLFRRAQPDRREMGILFALFSHLRSAWRRRGEGA